MWRLFISEQISYTARHQDDIDYMSHFEYKMLYQYVPHYQLLHACSLFVVGMYMAVNKNCAIHICYYTVQMKRILWVR